MKTVILTTAILLSACGGGGGNGPGGGSLQCVQTLQPCPFAIQDSSATCDTNTGQWICKSLCDASFDPNPECACYLVSGSGLPVLLPDGGLDTVAPVCDANTGNRSCPSGSASDCGNLPL